MGSEEPALLQGRGPVTRLERAALPPLWLPTLTRLEVVRGLTKDTIMSNTFSFWRWALRRWHRRQLLRRMRALGMLP